MYFLTYYVCSVKKKFYHPYQFLSDIYLSKIVCSLVHFCLVGNKNDDPERKVVLTEDAQRFAEQMKIKLFETSAKENINVEEV